MTLKPFIAAVLYAQCLCVSPIFAQAATDPPFPARPLRLIVPVATGGLTDSLGRTLALKLEQRLGQSVVVENRPGAGASIGATFAARAPADGLDPGPG